MLVNIDQLTAYMGGVNLTPKQRDITSNVILPGVQQELEEYCNRPLERIHIRENRPVDDRGFIVFTVAPVWKINFIADIHGVKLTLPPGPDNSTPLDDFVEVAGMRNVDKSHALNLGRSYEYFIGTCAGVGGPYWPLTIAGANAIGGTMQEPYWTCDYIGGWDGANEEGLDLAIMRVAAREVERQFDDTQSVKGGNQDVAQDSDTRDKYWTEDELTRWDRCRRRVLA